MGASRWIRPGLLVALLGAVSTLAVLVAGWEPVPQAVPSPLPTVAIAFDTLTPTPLPSRTPTRTPAPRRVPTRTPRPAAPAPRVDLTAFRGLGTWYDTYDYGTLDPASTARQMRAFGVRTLYLQTGRYTLPGDFKDVAEMSAWIRAAHANGMRIVGWYLPGYGNLDRDVHRTSAIASFRTSDGQRFDGLAVDIEDKCELQGSTCSNVKPVPGFTQDDWNAAIATHMRRVRAAVGSRYPMGAIVPPPLGMALRPSHWTGFPWRSLPAGYDVVMPMAYWSFRDDCPQVPSHCASGYTSGNVAQVRGLTGDRSLPVHVIGGVADNVSTSEVADFVSAARSAGVIGGSLYDYRTTAAAYWSPLRRLD